jgi:hypothetical protein
MSPSRPPHMLFNRTRPSTGQPTNLFGSSVAGPEKAYTPPRRHARKRFPLWVLIRLPPNQPGKPMQPRNAEQIKNDAAYM